MGDEAVEGSKMGTKLIMFVAIVALALVAFLVGKNLVNTGVTTMETASTSISDSRFSDYDKKTVRGRAVKSAIESFANEEYAIIVVTLSMADNKTGAIPTDTPSVKSTNAKLQNSKGDTVTDATGVNYNALLRAQSGTVTVPMQNGTVVYDDDFRTNTAGNVEYNLNTTNLTKKGTGEYIADASSFQANLIKSTAGEIMGIVFLQKKLY